jgi:hypothetical protein
VELWGWRAAASSPNYNVATVQTTCQGKEKSKEEKAVQSIVIRKGKNKCCFVK